MQGAISPSLKQMGLLVHTAFETPEGFSVTTVYCRIGSFTYSPVSKRLTIQHEFYIDREKRLQGYRRLQVTAISESYSFDDDSFPTMPSMYTSLKTTFVDLGFPVDDVFEEPPVADPPEGDAPVE
jgi:hypothetical protein